MAKMKINNFNSCMALVTGIEPRTHWLKAIGFFFCFFFFLKVDFPNLAMTTLLDHSMSSKMMY